MLDYYGEFGHRYDGVPVTQIVIYLGEKRSRMETSIDHPNLNFSFELIHISDIDPRSRYAARRRRAAGHSRSVAPGRTGRRGRGGNHG